MKVLNGRMTGPFLCCSALLFLGVAGQYKARSLVSGSDMPELQKPIAEFPATVGRWRGVDQPLKPSVIKVADADTFISRSYGSNETARYVYIAYYGRPYKDLPHVPELCLGGQGWRVVDKKKVDLTAAGDTFEVTHVMFERDTDKFAVLYWFVDTGVPVPALESWLSKVLAIFKTKRGEKRWVMQVQIQVGRPSGKPSQIWRDSDDLAREIWPELKKIFPAYKAEGTSK